MIGCCDDPCSRLLPQYHWRCNCFYQKTPNGSQPEIEGHKRSNSAKKSNEGETISHDSARELKRLLPAAAINLMNICFEIFKHGAVASAVDDENGLSFKPIGSELDRPQNGEREPTTVFKMSSNGQVYIALTAHAFKDYVCDWIWLVNDCYILHVSSLDGRLTKFYLGFSLENFNESDEELHNDLRPQILSQSGQTRNMSCGEHGCQ